MGFGHWIMDHFWLVAIASLFAIVGIHLAVSRLLRTARNLPNKEPSKGSASQ